MALMFFRVGSCDFVDGAFIERKATAIHEITRNNTKRACRFDRLETPLKNHSFLVLFVLVRVISWIESLFERKAKAIHEITRNSTKRACGSDRLETTLKKYVGPIKKKRPTR